MIRRNILGGLERALSDTPVVLVTGARQTGKSTLVRNLAPNPGSTGLRYATLDDTAVLAAAKADPAGFLQTLSAGGEPVVVDEVQFAPELLPAIKIDVDRDRRAGRFVLTGSANVLVLPKVSESLAGRIEKLTLWPFAQAEIHGKEKSLVDFLFSDEHFGAIPARSVPLERSDWVGRVVAGGYPEALERSADRRRDWFASYVTTILQRDVRDLANIEGLTQMPRLLALLATRTASLLNVADLSRTLGLPYTTLNRYLSLLEAIYLIRLLPAWTGNLGTRLLKTPKILLADTGLCAYLMGISAERVLENPDFGGGLLENFVAVELMKDAGWSTVKPAVYHWHTVARSEVDLVLESRDGRMVGVEVKASANVSTSDFRGLRALQTACERYGQHFHRGIVLYTGQHVLPFRDGMSAVPLSVLGE